MTTGQKMFFKFVAISAVCLFLGPLPKNYVLITVVILASIALIYNVLKYANEKLAKNQNIQS